MAFAESELPCDGAARARFRSPPTSARASPMGHGLTTSLLAVEVARELGCDDAQVRHVQQVSLIRFLGCTSDPGTLHECPGERALLHERRSPRPIWGPTVKRCGP